MDRRVFVGVFAKPPRPGEVKTRLAAQYGHDDAAKLARAFLQDTWTGVHNLAWARTVLATTEIAPAEFDLGPGVEAWLQGDGDLGARLERVLSRALKEHAAAIVFGADTPGLPPRIVEQARHALSRADAVIGPCEDGGFYLLGLRRAWPGLLSDLPWSHPYTFLQTLGRLCERGMTVRVLEPWFDVDLPRDLQRLRGLIEGGEVRAPATAAALARLLMPAGRTVSVVIPTLDEEQRIARQLASLTANPEVHEVIVVDGDSTDQTVSVARSFSGARVISAPRGRATQMNEGARLATGDVLLFLHADVQLPDDAVGWVRTALNERDVVGGAFRTRTVAEGRRSWAAPLLSLADLRSRYTPFPYGDQAIFVRTEVFHQVGGFPKQPLMEDLEFSRRLRRLGRIRTVPATVRVSGRRFLDRPLYYALLMTLLPVLYRLRVPPRLWLGLYGNPR